MATFQPIRFVPANRQTVMMAYKVESIIAVPHKKQGGTNHWCFYLRTSPGRSVRFDCQPSYSVPSTVLSGGSKANLVISELTYEVSHDAQTRFYLKVRSELTVADFYNTLVQRNRHKYEFDSNGVGCRYWTNSQLDLLLQAGIVTESQEVAAAKDGILKLWPDGTSLPLDQGAYYQ